MKFIFSPSNLIWFQEDLCFWSSLCMIFQILVLWVETDMFLNGHFYLVTCIANAIKFIYLYKWLGISSFCEDDSFSFFPFCFFWKKTVLCVVLVNLCFWTSIYLSSDHADSWEIKTVKWNYINWYIKIRMLLMINKE